MFLQRNNDVQLRFFIKPEVMAFTPFGPNQKSTSSRRNTVSRLVNVVCDQQVIELNFAQYLEICCVGNQKE